MEILVFASCQGVVFVTTVILLEVSLKPLAELEVVKIASLDELCDIDMSLDSVLIKGGLQELVVVNELVLVLG